MGNTVQSNSDDTAVSQGPLMFHEVHSNNVEISHAGRRVKRLDGQHGLCFSQRPVLPGERVCLRVTGLSHRHNNKGIGLHFGYTAVDPWSDSTGRQEGVVSEHGYWVKAVGETVVKRGSVLTFCVCTGGEVHYGRNDEEYGMLFAGVRTDLPLWVVIDLCGCATSLEFVDVNKDGKLQWRDFELARDYICKKSGWKEGCKQWTHCRELFVDLWRNLQDTADSDDDGQVTVDEWFQMWTTVLRTKVEHDKNNKGKRQSDVTTDGDDATDYMPPWFDRYVQYKFNLLDRAGDGVIDEEEFEFTLNDGFDVSPQDCRNAYRMMTKDGEKELDLVYFRELALEFYLSDKASDLGNFINGILEYD